MKYQDEDLWVAPQDWWSRAHPFRGVNDPRPYVVEPAAVAALGAILDTYRPQLVESLKLTRERGGTTIADAGEAYLATPHAHRSSLGAAAIWVLVDRDYDTCGCRSGVRHHAHLDNEIRGGFVDGWIAAHGFAFAAEAALRCHEITCDTEYVRPLQRQIYPLRFHDRDTDNVFGMFWSLAAPLRARLAGAPEAEYQSAVRYLSGLRGGDSRRLRLATSYLLPEQQEWVESDLSLGYLSEAQHPARILAPSLTRPQQFEALAATKLPHLNKSTEYSLLTQVGVAATPLFINQFEALRRGSSASAIRESAQLLTHFPTDDAYRALLLRADWKQVGPVLTEATTRYPRRAMRLLSEHLAFSPNPVIAQRLRLHALAHPDLVANHVHPGAAHLLDAGERLPQAPTTELPPLLVDPPWRHPRRTVAAPPAIPVKAPHRPLGLTWTPGESDSFRDSMSSRKLPDPVTMNWEQNLAEAIEHGTVAALLINATPDNARAALRTIRPAKLKKPARAVAALLGLYQHEAVEFAVAAALANSATTAPVLLPIDGTDISHTMVRWLRSKTARPTALEWFDRHAATAMGDVVAAALNAKGKERALAEDALRELINRGHRTAIDAAAESFGPAARTAIDTVLHKDPLLLFPARIPPLPDWLAPPFLPRIHLRDSATALPEIAVTPLLTMFMISEPDNEYAGLRTVLAALDPLSTTAFVTAVFDAWHLADYPGPGTWILYALGRTGNDETVDLLAPLITEWAAKSGHARSVAALDVLAAIGTDRAVEYLDALARQRRFTGLRQAAFERLGVVSARASHNP